MSKKDRPKTRGSSVTSRKPTSNTVASIQHTSISWPIPPPDILEKYKEIDPTIPSLIVQNFLDESDHRRALEENTLSANIKISEENAHKEKRGQIFGFLIGMVGLIVSTIIAIVAKDPTTASIVGGGTVVSLVVVFVTGKVIDKTKS